MASFTERILPRWFLSSENEWRRTAIYRSKATDENRSRVPCRLSMSSSINRHFESIFDCSPFSKCFRCRRSAIQRDKRRLFEETLAYDQQLFQWRNKRKTPEPQQKRFLESLVESKAPPDTAPTRQLSDLTTFLSSNGDFETRAQSVICETISESSVSASVRNLGDPVPTTSTPDREYVGESKKTTMHSNGMGQSIGSDDLQGRSITAICVDDPTVSKEVRCRSEVSKSTTSSSEEEVWYDCYSSQKKLRPSDGYSIVSGNGSISPTRSADQDGRHPVISIPLLPLFVCRVLSSSNRPTPPLSGRCPTCLATIPWFELVRRMPCQHYFHEECVKERLLATGTCPYCQQPVSSRR